MTNQLEKELKQAGLKKNEAEIYLYLIQNGISTPPQVAKGTGILRTNCYNIIQTLKEKDVIKEQKRGSRKAYIARDPESLKISLERKMEAVERILPDLRGLYTTQKNKPTFRFFEGFEEVKKIYDMTLSAESVYATGSTDRLRELDPDFFNSYFNKVDKNKIIFHDLLPAKARQLSAEEIKKMTGELYSIKFLPEQYKENLTDLLLWDNNVALIGLDEPIFGTVITHIALAKTFQALLKIIWDKI
jgi:predicted transcriptional regulator